MPYLNWKEVAIRKSVEEVTRLRAELRLSIPAGERETLASRLSEIFLAETLQEGGTELRVDLPDSWILFFKPREGGSRLLLAHPQKDEWVSTLALDIAHGQALVGRLRTLQPGEVLRVGELGAVDRISNVEILLEAIEL